MGKARDKMWAYCEKNDENNIITCRFCQKNFTGGITPMKYHWAKMNGYSAVPCMNVKDEVNREAVEAINLIKKESQMGSSIKVRTDVVPLQSYKVSSLYHEEVLDVVADAGVKPLNFSREMDEATDSDSNSSEDPEDEVPASREDLNLENRTFSRTMLPSYKQYLPVPRLFAKRYFPGDVRLSHAGRTWTLGWSAARKYTLTKGWMACRKEMGVKEYSIWNFQIMSNGDKGYVLNACHQSDPIGSDTGTSGSNWSEPDIPRGKRLRLTSGGGEKSIEKDEDEIKFVKEIKFESADHGNTNNRDNLYNLIVSCYGPLDEGNLPTSLGKVAAEMTDSILKMIPEIIKTKPSELSDEILENWEGVVQAAAGLKFNVGWLGDIVRKMRRHSNMNVKLQEERVESLKKSVVSLEEELDKTRKDLQIASSDLEKLKSFEASELFKFDCKKL